MDDLDVGTIGRKSAHGVLALISRQFLLNLISLGTSLVIFTYLKQSEVGIYTAVVAMQRIISFFTDFGLGAALVQKKEEISREDIKTVFTLQSSVTLLFFIIVFLLIKPISGFFNLDFSGQVLLLVLVFSIFLSSFKIIPSILLERTINFQKLIIPQIIESLAFNLILVILVLKGMGINSYSFAFLVSSVIGIPFYFYIKPWKIGIGINKKSLSHLKFGLQFQAKSILGTIKDDFLTVILAKFLGFVELGYIGFAQRLSFFMFRYIVDSVTKVTFSTYSRVQSDLAFLKKAIEKSLFFVSTAMFPTLTGLAILSPYVISFFPGWHNKWEPAVISIIFFCLNGLISSLSGILVNVLDGTGRVKTTLKMMVLWTTLTWVLTPILIKIYGFNGVSIASFIVALTIVITIRLVKGIVDFNFFESIKKPLIAVFIMDIVVFFISKMIIKDILTLIFVMILGGAIYSIILLSIAGKEIRNDLQKIFLKI
ncbi:MAG: oligosaccharide flippase family protein [Candidatus Levybacteria bacterium]|nr:oligosaccharide flippase family protein [Candidatus Levybacteria bacterium]